MCVCMCVYDLRIIVAIDELCKALGAPERRGAVQILIIIIIIIGGGGWVGGGCWGWA